MSIDRDDLAARLRHWRKGSEPHAFRVEVLAMLDDIERRRQWMEEAARLLSVLGSMAEPHTAALHAAALVSEADGWDEVDDDR